MTRKLTLLAILSICFQVFSAQPLIVDLLTDFKAPITGADGDVRGSVMVRRGTKLTVLKADDGNLRVKKDNLEFTIAADKTNFTEALEAYKKRREALDRRTEELAQKRAAEAEEARNAAAAAAAEAASQQAPDALKELFGDNLVDSKGKKRSVDELSGKVVGIYFSAHWCPPCRAFTPKLVEFHEKMTAAGKPFEIVFVSSDRSEDAMFDYMKETKMPWLSLPFGDKHKGLLSGKFGVRGIPTLVIVNEAGETVTLNGRGEVGQLSPEDAYTRWAKK
ncbi:MAG: thioredoxin-like domain-containing protein [Lentisphaeria bacterium]|nr:thioredoxin-like domain-containing protein [Lentisphaeria bacterium]